MPEAVAEHRPAPREPAPPAPRRSPPAVRLSSPAGAAPSTLPTAVREAVAAPGSGSPLAPEVAGPLGPRLGADLRPVRVHTDQRAAAASGALGARAFTWGTHVFLGAGEHATDLSVMAHELTHAVQQSAGPAVHLFGGRHGDLEHEAHQASASALRGQPFAVRGRTSGPRVQGLFGWVKRGIQAVGRAASAVASAVAELGSAIIDRALNFVKEHARSIPGYDLLAFIIGRDPITQNPVERSAINLIRGLVGLIPGGAALFENLQRTGVVQRAGDWFSAEVAKLNLTWEYIRGLFAQAWDALSVSDFVSPGTVWDKLKGVFGPPLTRIKNFALSAGRKILEFVFEGALALAGGAAQEVLAIFRRIGDVFGLVVADPIRFFRNLLNAVKGGFDLFWKNILSHLRTALFDWLLGALRGAVQLPARFDFQGILSVILQVLGLTYAALRGILVRIIGEPAVAFIEKAFDFLVTVATKGLTAAWEKIKEFASGLADSVIAAIRDWVARSVVGAAVTKLLTMFNPVGAIIQAVIGVYNTVMFFVERIRQIARLVRSILDSIESIARGNLSAAVQFVERTMANTLPVVLAFLGRLIGLGDVTKPVRDIIARIQGAISNAIERVARWIADRVKGLLGKEPAKPPDERTPAQKEAALSAAIAEAEPLLLAPNTSSDKVIAALPAIKSKHRLTTLRLTTLKVDGANETGQIEGSINPTKKSKTADLTAAPRPTILKGKATPNLDQLATYPDERARNVHKVYCDAYEALQEKGDYDDVVDYVEQRALRKLGRLAEGPAIAMFIAKSGIQTGPGELIEIHTIQGGVLARARDRRPDFFTKGTVVGDVKRTADQSLDEQLRDDVLIALGGPAADGQARLARTSEILPPCARGFHLIVRGPADDLPNGTHVSGPLRTAIRRTGGRLWRLLK
jgi:hypothetical protein